VLPYYRVLRVPLAEKKERTVDFYEPEKKIKQEKKAKDKKRKKEKIHGPKMSQIINSYEEI